MSRLQIYTLCKSKSDLSHNCVFTQHSYFWKHPADDWNLHHSIPRGTILSPSKQGANRVSWVQMPSQKSITARLIILLMTVQMNPFNSRDGYSSPRCCGEWWSIAPSGALSASLILSLWFSLSLPLSASRPVIPGSLKKLTALKVDENQLTYLPDSIGGWAFAAARVSAEQAPRSVELVRPGLHKTSVWMNQILLQLTRCSRLPNMCGCGAPSRPPCRAEVRPITGGSTAKIRSTEPFWDYCLQPDDKSGHRLQLRPCCDPSTALKDHESENFQL